jgi:uncharacterized protein with PIN domain
MIEKIFYIVAVAKNNNLNNFEGRSKNKKRRPTEESCCPICNERLTGTAEELNGHVEGQLKNKCSNVSSSTLQNEHNFVYLI